MGKLVDKALSAPKESGIVDFKTELDFSAPHTWCELTKDILAMANSGGGVILVGVDDSGKPCGGNLDPILILDPATVTDKVFKYTGVHFGDFEITARTRRGRAVAALEVGPSETPIVFTKPGTYSVAGGQKTAFSKGTVYFRHGAKSEPGTTRDLERYFERRLTSVRKAWFSGMRKVTQAPPGASVVTLTPGQEVVLSSSPRAVPVRLTDDPAAPAYRNIDHDATHPYRQKELVAAVNERLSGAASLTGYDIQCVKRAYAIDQDKRFCHHSKYASPQYSEAFADWLVEKFESNASFFDEARRKAKEVSRSERGQPHPGR